MQNNILCFISLLTAKFVKITHIYHRVYFIFQENVLKQASNIFNTKFQPQSTDQKSSYQVSQVFGLFSNLICLTLGSHDVKEKGPSVSKIVKEIKFEGALGKLQSRKRFQRQSVTKYLRLSIVFIRKKALRERFNCYFLGRFASTNKIFILAMRIL